MGEAAGADVDGHPRLWRSRQFLLGPARADRVESWVCTDPGAGLVLETHPDLPVAQAAAGALRLTLLGYIVDPDHPERCDAEILAAVGDAASLDDLHERPAPTGGRWALVAALGSEVRVFTDPVGMRQVHYATSRSGDVWCASQAGMLAQVLGLEVDPAAAEFARSVYVRTTTEYWWPGDTTLYRGVRRLLPNHRLEMSSGSVTRYWPTRVEPLRSREEVVPAGATMLRRLVEAVARRGPIALGVTAGLDTRILLAASRNVAPAGYTIDPVAIGHEREDRDVPERLLPRLGLRHEVLTCPTEPDSPFRRLYEASFDTAHPEVARLVLGLRAGLPRGAIFVSGSCSEITRAGCRTHWGNVPASAAALALVENMQLSSFAAEAIDRWLREAVPVAARTGYDYLDLYYWELHMGSWLAAGVAEWDMACDTFAPFDCRSLIEMLLSCNLVDRLPPHRLHLDMIGQLWPEVLSEPVNPGTRASRLRTRLRRGGVGVLRATGAYRPVKAVYLAARSRRRRKA